MTELTDEYRQVHGEGCDLEPENLPICKCCKKNECHLSDAIFCTNCKDETLFEGKYFDVFVENAYTILVQSRNTDSKYKAVFIDKNEIIHLFTMHRWLPEPSRSEYLELWTIYELLKQLL